MPDGPPNDDFAAFARELATRARGETLARFGGVFDVENKAFGDAFDPVTDADRAAERAMRALIPDRFPGHGIHGEEYSDTPPAGRYAWSLDPIDGTRSFVCGLPTWTTLIALLEDGRPVVGLIDTPRLDETYVGFGDRAVLVRGGEEAAIRTSGCIRLAQARFSTTDPFLLGLGEEALQRLTGAVQVSRYGHDAYAYARLAAGSLDLVVEAGLKPHDYNALIPVVRAAGGHVGDWAGGEAFANGDVIAAASRQLYEEALALLAE